MAKGFGGMPGNMKEMMRQAQKMQEQIMQAQERAKSISEEGSAGGGMVKAVVNGEYSLQSISIEREVVDPEDISMLQDLIVAAVNEAVRKVKDAAEEEMNKVTGGMSIPGLV